MSIKPILFNTEMVRAILEGRKTVTRRVVKMDRPSIYKAACSAGRWSETFGGEIPDEVVEWYAREVAKPHYQSGDILWVRETWRVLEAGCPPPHSIVEYKAGGTEKFREIVALPTAKGEWRPSIHMPKEAARLFLRVTAVRVERLQAITPEECVCEGAVSKPHYMRWGGEKSLAIHSRYRRDFENLWNSTLKPADLPRYGWDANPWVWVIEFERCEKPEGWEP